MTTMFWGLRMEPGKRYSTTVGRPFHVSMAALDCSNTAQSQEVSSVMLEEGVSDVPFILCNLTKEKYMQCPLDLNFATGDRITFFCKGSGTIHLSGYVHEEDEFDNLLGEEEEDEEDEEDEDAEEGSEEEDENALSKTNGLKSKRALDVKTGKKAKKLKIEASEDSDEELDDDDDDLVLEQLDEESSDDEDEGEEDEDGKESPEPVKTKPVKQAPVKQKKSKVNGLNVQLSKKEKKAGEAAVQGKTKEVQQKQQKNQAAQPQTQKKTIEGGVHIKDTRVGTGAVCKPGQKASVYYIGRFKDNNKVFDSSRKGNGFSFIVGKGDVIKGWDVGVVGMKVGGKRTITCPPNMAYGQKGCPPTIPGNSTLTFEVELRNVG